MQVSSIRDEFPICSTQSDHELVYLDHAASTHAPKPILDLFLSIMEETYANVHRGEHRLSKISSDMIDAVPQIVSSFLGGGNLEDNGSQVIFSSNTTSSLDLASHVFASKEGSVLTTVMEHHSNDLPHRQRGEVFHAGVDERGMLVMDEVEDILQKQNIKLLSVTGGSNVTGYLPPVAKLARLAHDNGARILIDGAQRLAHARIDIQPIDHPEHIDFFAAAGHKTYAPFGSSFLFGRTDDFDEAPPYIPSGGTVSLVTEDEVVYLKGQDRHTYGTPNIAGVIAFGRAIQYIDSKGMDRLRIHEIDLLKKMSKGLQSIDEITIYGDIPIDQKIGVVAFNVAGKHHRDVAAWLDQEAGIAVRNGRFCAHPYMFRLLKIPPEDIRRYVDEVSRGIKFNVPGAVRASIGCYNNDEEIDKFLEKIEYFAKSTKL